MCGVFYADLRSVIRPGRWTVRFPASYSRRSYRRSAPSSSWSCDITRTQTTAE